MRITGGPTRKVPSFYNARPTESALAGPIPARSVVPELRAHIAVSAMMDMCAVSPESATNAVIAQALLPKWPVQYAYSLFAS